MKEMEMDFYLVNRERINNLYLVAANYRQWLHTIFTDTDFIRRLGDFTLVCTDNENNSKFGYTKYRLWDTDELIVNIFYEYLWNSKPGEARLCLFLEPTGKWFEKAVTNEAVIRSIAGANGVPSKERHKHYWHCAAQEIIVPEGNLANKDALKGYLIDKLSAPDSKLMTTAREISSLLSPPHTPSFQWEDAFRKLKELILNEFNDKSDYLRFLESYMTYISFDPKEQIVLIEVPGDQVRDDLERKYYGALMRAIKYAFGEEARCAIMCHCIYY